MARVPAWLKRISAQYRAYGKFDKERAAQAVRFIEMMPHVKGEWVGQTIRLEPIQKLMIEDIFGILGPDGRRMIRTAYIELPRKNAKTTIAAAAGNKLFYADGEKGCEIYSAAHDKDQATISWSIANQMAKRIPALAKRTQFQDYRTRMFLHDGSFFRAIERDAASQHGYNAHGIIFDELHTQATPELYEVLKTSTGSRSQPLTFAITTAGYDRETICWRLHDYARKLINGVLEDSTFYPVIFSAVTEDDEESKVDWLDEKLWKRANPLLGVSFEIDHLRAEAKQAVAMPDEQNTFKRLHLNIWTQSSTRLIDGAKWAACGDDSLSEASLYGMTAFGGLDLASTGDLASFCWAVPLDDKIALFWRFWCPKEGIQRRSHDDGLPYEAWADQGLITATPGAAIDFDTIEKDVKALCAMFDMQSIAYDRWQAIQLAQHLEAEGTTMVATGMGFSSLTDPTKTFIRWVISQKIVHDNHRLMRWQVDNLVGEIDASENVKPSKKKSSEKIDGCMAAILAIDRVIRTGEGQSESIYETRGPVVLGA